MQTLIDLLSLPQLGLPTLFVVAFVSATLIPMGSEPVLFALVKLNPDLFWPAIAVATVGNTLGGMTTYYLGYGAAHVWDAPHTPRGLRWLQRVGAPVLVLSWLPVVGDALCAMSGWLKLPWRGVLLWIALGKGLRYFVLTWLLLRIPNAYCQAWF